MYSEYTNNFDRASKLFEELKRKKKFTDMRKDIETQPECNEMMKKLIEEIDPADGCTIRIFTYFILLPNNEELIKTVRQKVKIDCKQTMRSVRMVGSEEKPRYALLKFKIDAEKLEHSRFTVSFQ
ncbi:hypothetical protein B9Z55_015692 [Caenorhabditis nigoni]|uniref:Uncharacterized protein n=1 Tax=Caenorhabditis nigoni TaxID=1611254 RepID=A0A2G5UC68_9PELO|nr:hypothetical protein B9Z55_015692 [Caenorhabditis nigoni]